MRREVAAMEKEVSAMRVDNKGPDSRTRRLSTTTTNSRGSSTTTAHLLSGRYLNDQVVILVFNL